MATGNEPLSHKWIGGRLCLDFNNTIDWTGLEPVEDERLAAYDALVQWSAEADVITESDRVRLMELAGERPRAAERVLRRAREIRTTIHALFYAVVRGGNTDPEQLKKLNGLLSEAPVQIYPRGATEPLFAWGWSSKTKDLDGMLWPVVWSAARLLTSPELTQVKTCAKETCGWLFLDTSRKHNRRWCEMGTCGNRAKARRYYERSRT